MKSFSLLPLLFCTVYSAPKLRIYPEQTPAQLLTLPSNATSIRLDISDSFSCEGREYGYYADIENDCQLFHVCLPVTYSDGRNQTFRWSFICPEDTVFNQEMFTCTRYDESMDCADSARYYSLNSHFGEVEEDPHHRRGTLEVERPHRGGALGESDDMPEDIEDDVSIPEEVPQSVGTSRRARKIKRN